MTIRKITVAVLTCWAVLSLRIPGGPADAEDESRDASLDRMRALAERTEVLLVGEQDAEEAAELIPQPAFRYSDEARSIHDSTLWIWTDGVRPVALQKIEDSQHHGSGQQRWTYCLTSLADRLIRVEWESGRTYESREPGLEWQPLPGAPEPARSDRARMRQFRQLARRFAATILINPKTDDQLEMRLLPRPIFLYGTEPSGVPTGAVFGFATDGTNPDLLLVIELRPDQAGESTWQFAAARMTTGGLTLRHKDEPVWTAEFVRPIPQPWETWTFYFVPRKAE